MQVSQLLWDIARSWRRVPSAVELSTSSTVGADSNRLRDTDDDCSDAQLVLVFGGRAALGDRDSVEDALADLRARCPRAAIACCSGGGQIVGVDVVDDTFVATAIRLDYGSITAVSTTIEKSECTEQVGARLAEQLPVDGLRYVLVLSDGLRVNGSALIRGMTSKLSADVRLSGGLAADNGEFAETLVGLDEAPAPGRIVAIGFYGDRLVVGHGSLGGWEMFGPNRRVTRASGNVVYELDGQPALALYKRYLGSFADGLPASALLFPLCLQAHEHAETGLVRTVLGVNDADDSMTFAGDVPEGTHVRLMRTSREGLVAGAEGAALVARRALGDVEPQLVLLVSCIGRRLVLKHRVDEEVEGARAVMGLAAPFTGFYSFGELAPSVSGGSTVLHNQTMTITALAEA
jgi:hypothetical protein